ncbi:unnamed protein product, partial [marine sediment metagenome]
LQKVRKSYRIIELVHLSLSIPKTGLIQSVDG